MASNFATGVVVGIVISVIAMNVFFPKDDHEVTQSSYTSGSYGHSYSSYDDDYDREDFGLHERSFD